MENGNENKVENAVDFVDDEGKKEMNTNKDELTVEQIFEKEEKEVLTWKKQLTVRAFVVSFLLSVMFAFIVMKLNLTTGIIPSLNVAAGLLGFFFVKTWTKLLERSGTLRQPFTRQENTVIQTCVVASSGIAFSVLAFCNAFGCGLTDWSLASAYGKLAIFTMGRGRRLACGALAGLAACGVMMNIVSTASDLMQDFKTGYMTLASPRSMFVSQLIGTAMGCVISPCVFWIFYKAFPDLGKSTSQYPAPYAIVYYEMAKLGVEGFSALPKECLNLCYAFFAASIVINLIRDALGKKRAWFIPLPMAMAIPFYLGPYFAIDMCVGSLILYIWQKRNRASADALAPAVASGLICGDGIWALPNSILALAGVKPPICMKFLSRGTNSKVDGFLGT
ncbi:hypothetical protein DH2020_019475 [Rehmannia glutinosa]|uniref:Uncharacterized protein n=1 Tax=Rehmannia glutinosa TaxID=99300 RepID=A0ABR0WNT9_REHGL